MPIVGIGTTTPGQKLQVGASGDGSVAVANAWNTFSDIRLKTGLERIPNACEMVEKVLPELVKTGSDGIKTVDYPKLTAVLIEASKQHNRDIASIKVENARLKQENSEMKTRLDKIEKMVNHR